MTAERLQRHWVLAANLAVAVFLALPILAPVLLAAGFDTPANWIYAAYHSVCHQWAFRSYFLFGSEVTYDRAVLAGLVGHESVFTFVGSPDLGYKVAFCERDLAIYASVLLAGLGYAWKRGQISALGFSGYLLLIAPMALDGFTQLFNLRESTPELRTFTGALFGVASVWLIYPRVD
ncbi:MAG: DUF2085 domain-containing protein, partial [Chloroflexota bacterium]